MVLEGFASALYHICPTPRSFQIGKFSSKEIFNATIWYRMIFKKIIQFQTSSHDNGKNHPDRHF